VVVPGTEKNDVWNVEDIYGREQELGENIVIVGGNESGVEAAIHLLDKGKKVTVVASGKRLVPNTDFTARLPLIYRTENRADIYTNSRVTKIMEKSVLVHNKESEQDTTVYADSVVFAIGLENRVKDAFEYSELTNNFHIIGDAKKIADIEEATRTGYYAALQI
jgi:pyruvate/2-oxoglutarate dehydrogenase complex dihydrolipoamide dehydrogenase (E3) component